MPLTLSIDPLLTIIEDERGLHPSGLPQLPHSTTPTAAQQEQSTERLLAQLTTFTIARPMMLDNH